MLAKITLLIEVIKSFKNLLNLAITFYEKYQDRQIDKHYEKKKKRRDRLLNEMKENQHDDEKLKDTLRKLSMLDSTRE